MCIGMQPLLYSSISQQWQRVGSKVTYYHNNIQKIDSSSSSNALSVKAKGSSTNRHYYTTTFTVVFPSDDDTCYLSYHYPYTYSMLQVCAYMSY